MPPKGGSDRERTRCLEKISESRRATRRLHFRAHVFDVPPRRIAAMGDRDPHDETSHELVMRIRARDSAAIDALFGRYREPLRRGLRRMLGPTYRNSVLDSEDATQDAILSALKRIDDFEYRGSGSFLAWLLTAARNEVRQRIKVLGAKKRKSGTERHLESVSEPRAGDPTPSEAAVGRELEAQVQAILDDMPAQERSVIVLKRYAGLTTSEIRAELSLASDGAVRALLSRAQLRLAQRMDTGSAEA